MESILSHCPASTAFLDHHRWCLWAQSLLASKIKASKLSVATRISLNGKLETCERKEENFAFLDFGSSLLNYLIIIGRTLVRRTYLESNKRVCRTASRSSNSLRVSAQTSRRSFPRLSLNNVAAIADCGAISSGRVPAGDECFGGSVWVNKRGGRKRRVRMESLNMSTRASLELEIANDRAGRVRRVVRSNLRSTAY